MDRFEELVDIWISIKMISVDKLILPSLFSFQADSILSYFNDFSNC